MTYRELLEITQKYPNPFYNKKQHEIEAEFRYKQWVSYMNSEKSAKEENQKIKTDKE